MICTRLHFPNINILVSMTSCMCAYIHKYIHTYFHIDVCTSHQCRAFSHHSAEEEQAETGRELWENASKSQGTKSFPYATAGRFHTSWSVIWQTDVHVGLVSFFHSKNG